MITTTTTTFGCSWSTSTCRTVAASSGGAETSASSRVTCDRISVVACSASSTSGARCRQLERELGRPRLLPREQPVDVDAVAGLGRHAPRRGVRVREQPEPLELRQLRAHGRRRHREASSARRAASSRPARPSRRTPRRRATGSPAAARTAPRVRSCSAMVGEASQPLAAASGERGARSRRRRGSAPWPSATPP